MEPPTFSLSSLIRLPATKRSKFKQNDDDTEITDCEVLGRDENLELNSKITRNNQREKDSLSSPANPLSIRLSTILCRLKYTKDIKN